MSSDYLGDRSMWATRFANTTLGDYNTAWEAAYGTETDAWTESDAATDFMLDTIRDAGYDTVKLNVDFGSGAHYLDPNTAWYQRRDYMATRGKDPLAYFIEQATARGIKVVADIFSCRTFNTTQFASWVVNHGAGQDFYDPSIAAFRTAWIARVLDLIERYDIYEVMLDYHRTGVENAGTRTARRDDLTAMIQGIKDGLAGVGKPNMRISVWGHNSTGRLNQGNWCAWWVENGYVDRHVDGNYGFFPDDSVTMDMRQVDYVTGMDTYTAIAGAIPDLAASGNLGKFEVAHSSHYRDSYGGGGNEYTFMSKADRLLMANQARLASPNTGLNSYLFSYTRDTDLATSVAELFNNDNTQVDFQSLTGSGLGKLYYRRNPDTDRTVTNLLRTPVLSNSGDTSGATGSATHEGGNTFSSSATSHNAAFNGSLLGSYGAATLRFRARITTTIANQIVRLRMQEAGETAVNYDKTFATPGTYEICSGAHPFLGNGNLNVFIYPHRAAAAAQITIDNICLTDGTDPQEYVYTDMGALGSQMFANAKNAVIIDDTADLKVLGGGVLVTENTLIGMRTSPLSRNQVEVETYVRPQFASTDDKGSHILVQAGESASDDFWEVRFNQTAETIQLRTSKAGTLTTYSRTLSYSSGDLLRIRAVMSTTTGITLDVENLTAATSTSNTWTTGDALSPFRNQMMTFVGSRLGYNNGNQSDYWLESVEHGTA